MIWLIDWLISLHVQFCASLKKMQRFATVWAWMTYWSDHSPLAHMCVYETLRGDVWGHVPGPMCGMVGLLLMLWNPGSEWQNVCIYMHGLGMCRAKWICINRIAIRAVRKLKLSASFRIIVIYAKCQGALSAYLIAWHSNQVVLSRA